LRPGPSSRALLQAVSTGAEIAADALPNNHWVAAMIAGVDIRLHRMSYSGELAFEVYVPSGYALTVWQALMDAGKAFDLKPYGTEAMGALRIEKGHVAGPEIDGRTTLRDLGLEGFASSKKPFVGSVLRHRPALRDPARPRLVGLVIDGPNGTSPGALLFHQQGPAKGHVDGHVTSTTWSPALQKHIALGLLANGPERLGETVRCIDFVGNSTVLAEVVSQHFYDPKGVRQNA
jgi:glycine cleavage system aminomethyltransferase T